MTSTLPPRRAVRRDVNTHPTVASVVYRTHDGVQPVPGQLWRHKTTQVQAEFLHWRQQPDWFGGQWVMVLFNPRYGECRWSPGIVERIRT